MKQILVVDDDPILRDALQEKFTAESFTVLLARDGGEALEMLTANIPDLIVLDIMMPNMDGIEFVHRLHLVGKDDIPIIILTNVAGTAYPAQVREYLVKSDTSLKLLVDTIHKYI